MNLANQTCRTVLVVDDDPRTVEIIRLRLETDGFRVVTASDGKLALDQVQREQPDLIVLDLMLPLIDGLDVCHILRVEGESHIPIVMLTARVTEEDRLRGLNGGADDYITKPFSPRELSARINAVLRRSKLSAGARADFFQHGALKVDLARVEARLAGQLLPLTPTEFTLLATLIEARGRAFSRHKLLERAFGYTYDGMERTIDVHIANLRKKLEADPTNPVYIVTVYGVGYRFEGPEGFDEGVA